MNTYFEQNPAEVAAYQQRFLNTMAFVSSHFPWGFRRTANGTATPRARFEAIAIGSYLALLQRPELAKQKFSVEVWIASDEFAKVTGSDGANAKGRLNARMYFVRDRLLGAIE